MSVNLWQKMNSFTKGLVTRPYYKFDCMWRRRKVSAQEVIEAQIKSGNVKFDLAGFLQNVVMADIPSPGGFGIDSIEYVKKVEG